MARLLSFSPAADRERLEAEGGGGRGRRRAADDSDPDFEVVSRAAGPPARRGCSSGQAEGRARQQWAGCPRQLCASPILNPNPTAITTHSTQFEYRPRAQPRRSLPRLLSEGLSPAPTPLAATAAGQAWDAGARMEASLAENQPGRHPSLPVPRPQGPVS